MTEQEAINEIRNRECVECIGNDIGCGSCSYKVAINALEEIQQYRAMEKRLKAIYGDCPGMLETVVEHLERHNGVDIGEPVFKARLLTDEDVDKWEAYKAIGTPEECKEAVEKQRAKRIIHEPNAGRERDWRCPNCDSYINPYAKYCIGCGQKLKGGGADGNNRKDCLR